MAEDGDTSRRTTNEDNAINDEVQRITIEEGEMEEGNKETGRPTLWQIIKRERKLLLFIFFVTKEFVDCILDWVFYSQLNSVEDGLVYGPVDKKILQSLLIFSLIGTIAAVIDFANRLCDLECTFGLTFVNIHKIEACVMFLEDIPQMVIGLLILYTRESEEGVISLIKGIIIFCGTVVHMFSFLLSNNIGDRMDDKKNHCVGVRAIGIGLILNLAIILFVFNVGSFGLNPQYFSNVAIYCGTSDPEFPFDNFESMSWMKFFDINDIQTHGDITAEVRMNMSDLRVTLFYNEDHRKGIDLDKRLVRTYNIGPTEPIDCTLFSGSRFHFRFIYLPPSTRHILGDIQYNVRKTPIYSCDNMVLQRVPPIKYFQTNATRTENETDQSIYSLEENLISIDMVWKLGIGNLSYRGSGSPHFNPDIAVLCFI